MTQGDDFLKKELDQAIAATSRPECESGVCSSHDALRHGVNVLLLCKRSEMEGTPAVSKTGITLISSGVATAIMAIIEILKKVSE
jgi:hypothetical protein